MALLALHRRSGVCSPGDGTGPGKRITPLTISGSVCQLLSGPRPAPLALAREGENAWRILLPRSGLVPTVHPSQLPCSAHCDSCAAEGLFAHTGCHWGSAMGATVVGSACWAPPRYCPLGPLGSAYLDRELQASHASAVQQVAEKGPPVALVQPP